MVLPDRTPGEPCEPPTAVAPPVPPVLAPPPLWQWSPVAPLPTPTTLTLSPQALTGMLIGAWMVLPDSTPGEPCEPPTAVAPPVPPWSAPAAVAPPEFEQWSPAAGLSRPTTFAVMPQTLIGMLIGTWMVLPERTPGEPEVVAPSPDPALVASACAIPAPPAARSPPVVSPKTIRRFTCDCMKAPALFRLSLLQTSR